MSATQNLPGEDLIHAGLRDVAAGVESAESLLVEIAASRLRESGLPIGRIVQYLSTARLPRSVADCLRLRAGSAMQRLDIEAFAGRDSPVYFQTLWIPPNKRRLQLPGDGR